MEPQICKRELPFSFVVEDSETEIIFLYPQFIFRSTRIVIQEFRPKLGCELGQVDFQTLRIGAIPALRRLDVPIFKGQEIYMGTVPIAEVGNSIRLEFRSKSGSAIVNATLEGETIE